MLKCLRQTLATLKCRHDKLSMLYCLYNFFCQYIIIRKYLIIRNCIYSLKVQGIIGTCRIIDHIIWQTEFIDVDSNVTFVSIDDLPAGNAQVAARYIGK